jgi:four helix bundle protein
MSSYKDLEVYHLANANAIALYKCTRGIRGSDNLGLRSQLTRAAFGIPTNIVEGSKAESAKEFSRYVKIAINSSWELEHHLETLADLELLSIENAGKALKNNEKARKMLSGLRDYLDRRHKEDQEREAREQQKKRKKKRNKNKPEHP